MRGVADAGLSTTGQPAAMAGPTLWHTRFSGKLNGEMAATTPMGTRWTKASLPTPAELASMGIISPARVRATAAENRRVSTARAASTRAVLMGLADSAEIDRANSSFRAAKATAARSRISARSNAGSTPARWRARAMATAWSRWSSVPTGTRPTTSPLNGERTSAAVSVVTDSAPMRMGVTSVAMVVLDHWWVDH